MVEDGRYDYIETGHLVSCYENVKDIKIPYGEERILLGPLDFEEFLWAMGDDDPFYWMRKAMDAEERDLRFVSLAMMNDLRRYMIVGGMPAAVAEYAESRDLRRVESVKSDIVELYRSECGPSERTVFDRIPYVLSGREAGFAGASIDEDEAMRAIVRLGDSKVVELCRNEACPEFRPASFTLYLADTGLLVTHAIRQFELDMESIYADLLMDDVGMFGGMFVDNLACQMLGSGDAVSTYDTSGSKSPVKADFIIRRGCDLCPVFIGAADSMSFQPEIFMKRLGKRMGRAYILYAGDEIDLDGATSLPLCMAPLLRRVPGDPGQELDGLRAPDLGGELRQPYAPALVEFDALAVVVEHPEHEDRQRVPGMGRAGEEVVSPAVVHGDARARVVHHAEREHRVGIPAFRGGGHHLGGEFGVAFDPFAVEVPQTDEVQRMRVPLAGGLGVPLHRDVRIRIDSLSGLVHPAEVEHRIHVALFGGEGEHAERLDRIPADPPPVEVEDAQVALGGRVALVGGQHVPFGGLHLVDRDALALVAHVSEAVLGLHVALVGGPTVPLDGVRLVHRDPDAVAAEVSEGVLRRGHAGVGGDAHQRYGLSEIALDAVPLVVLLPEEVLGLGIPALAPRGQFQNGGVVRHAIGS